MGYTDEMIEKAKAAGELSEEELANVAGGGCDGQGDHVVLPGGVCSYCGAENPTGYYKSVLRSHNPPNYYMERLDCCGQTMQINNEQARKLQKIN